METMTLVRPDVKIVGRGVDTLVLNVSYADKQFQPIKQELDANLQEELNRLQGEARLAESPLASRWAFKGFTLFMKEKGSRGQWRWILTCPLVSVAISRGRLSPIIAQVRLSSEYLWSCETVSDAIVEVSLLLFDLFGEYLWVQVSQVDLCADSIGWDVASTNWLEAFVSRAVGQNGRPADIPVDGPDVARLRWKQIATLDFGRHTSPISCCIYHKSAEIRQKSPKKAWFYDLWKRNGWDGESEVWRVEFRLTREFLHSVHIEDVHDLPERLPSLWEYCAGRAGGAGDGLPDGWLRYVIPSATDTTRSRWPVHPAWEVIQGAFASEDDGLGPLVRERIREKNIRQGLASVIGYLSTLSAWVGGDLASREVDISQVLHWLYDAGADFLDEKGCSFADLVRQKRLLYRSDDELAS
jgi:hypothetical protein